MELENLGESNVLRGLIQEQQERSGEDSELISANRSQVISSGLAGININSFPLRESYSNYTTRRTSD